LPVSALKIDRSFVTEMGRDDHNRAIVRSTIALARSLDLQVIAEGVEDVSVLQTLAEMKSDQAQGYGICRPLPLDDLLVWIGQQDK
jgi:EAL domain-containing protein (putative c-di-GMP-specific phosphodiesterase class I)